MLGRVYVVGTAETILRDLISILLHASAFVTASYRNTGFWRIPVRGSGTSTTDGTAATVPIIGGCSDTRTRRDTSTTWARTRHGMCRGEIAQDSRYRRGPGEARHPPRRRARLGPSVLLSFHTRDPQPSWKGIRRCRSVDAPPPPAPNACVRPTALFRLPAQRGGEFSCRSGGEFQCRLTDEIDGREPLGQRKAVVLEQRSGGWRGLEVAADAVSNAASLKNVGRS